MNLIKNSLSKLRETKKTFLESGYTYNSPSYRFLCEIERSLLNDLREQIKNQIAPKNEVDSLVKTGYNIGDIVTYKNINKIERGKIFKIFQHKFYVYKIKNGRETLTVLKIRSVSDIIHKEIEC